MFAVTSGCFDRHCDMYHPLIGGVSVLEVVVVTVGVVVVWISVIVLCVSLAVTAGDRP